MWQHNGEGITVVQVLYVVIAVHLHAGGNGDRVAKLLSHVKILYVRELLYLPRAVKGRKAGA